MNHKGKNQKYKTHITNRILLEYLLSLVGLVIAMLFGVILSYQVARRFVWYPDSILYQVLIYIRDYLPIFIALPLILGWMVLTYYFIRKPLRYLDEVIVASKQLVHPTQEQIILSNAIKSVQDELNQVREVALKNDMLAKEAEQRKNDLVVYLAHDLKTPLTSVIGYLTLLHDEEQISEELRVKYLSISLQKAQRLEDLINEFFEITRFNLSHIQLQYRTVNLTRFLQQLTFEFEPMFIDKNLHVKLSVPPDITIKCDVDKMQRVFDNLLRNAVFYSFSKSEIKISVEQTATETHIHFTNQGNTIPQEKLDRIFEQFYRLDTSRSSNSGGAGLGLAIAKQIVESHKGRIFAWSKEEQIEFCVVLPTS